MTSWAYIAEKKATISKEKRHLSNFDRYFDIDYAYNELYNPNTSMIQTTNAAVVEYFFDLLPNSYIPTHNQVVWYHEYEEGYDPDYESIKAVPVEKETKVFTSNWVKKNISFAQMLQADKTRVC